ncbi:MAG TPA: high-affinity nickel-transport family protein [Candidatus Limnocylindria bacterium]|jgi:high-affinity nickel-transport protein|nr:high-affinity nickel-transport family protein [Candidatus Limnocylindria bacterium]
MTELLTLAGFGFLLGMRHATDADHVIAVTTILNRSRRFVDATVIGAIWGLGHTVTVVVVGMLIIVFGIVIPPAVGLGMELGVAIMLIGLGILNLTGAMRRLTERFTPPAPLHGHSHEHLHSHAEGEDAHRHGHAHLHGHGTAPGLVETFGWFQLGRPLAVGLVHGLAGSAAVALLVLTDLAINDRGQAMAYLVIFCAGVAAGMAILTTLIGLPFMVSQARSERINRWLTIGSGVLSLAFGLYLAYQIGIVDGLFTGDFHWEPA